MCDELCFHVLFFNICLCFCLLQVWHDVLGENLFVLILALRSLLSFMDAGLCPLISSF